MINNRLTALACLVVGATGLHGQQTNVCTITGYVRDVAGEPVPGARLSLKGPNLLGERIATSDSAGRFRLPLILPGNYRLIVGKDGFIGAEATVSLSAGGTILQSFILKPLPKEVASATVEVVASSGTVDKSDTAITSTVNAEQLKALPVNRAEGEFFRDVLSLTPGVVADPNVTGAFAIRGSIAGQSSIKLNDIEVRGGSGSTGLAESLILFDSVQEFQVIQTPLHPKYGNTSGGVINVVTKTGNNEFSGSLMWPALTKDSWISYNGHQLDRFGAQDRTNAVVGTDQLKQDVQAFVSGPIIKDKLTFTYGYKSRPTTTTVQSLGSIFNNNATNTRWWTYLPGLPGTTGTNPGVSINLMGYTWGQDYRTPTTVPSVDLNAGSTWNQFKVFYQIDSDRQLEINYTRMVENSDGGIMGDSLDTAALLTQNRAQDIRNVIYRWVTSANSTLELKASQTRDRSKSQGGNADPLNVTAWGYGSRTGSFFQPNGSGYYFTGFPSGGSTTYGGSWNDQDSYNINYQLIRGKHSLDFGLELQDEIRQDSEDSGPNRRKYYAPGRYYDGRIIAYKYNGSPASGTDADAVQMREDMPGLIPEMDVYSDTGSDSPVKNTSLSLYANDTWTLSDRWTLNMGGRFDQHKVKDRTGTRIDVTTFSPRLQATWDLNGDNRSLVSFSYGVFRGFFGNNILGEFIRVRGNVVKRYFWDQGSTDPYTRDGANAITGINPAALVNIADFMNPANFTYLYSAMNKDLAYQIPDKHMKPEVTRQAELVYRRAFHNGGFFRASVVYRKTSDLAMMRNVDTPINAVDSNDPGGVPASTYTYLRQLVNDPNAFMVYRSVETEWALPVFSGKNWKLDWHGNLTVAREKGRYSYTGNHSTFNALFQDALANIGVTQDDVQPYGEMTAPHNTLNSGFMWSQGNKSGVRTSATLMVNYTQGAPDGSDPVTAYYYPAGALSAMASQYTQAFTIYPAGIGRRNAQEYFNVSLTWNMEIPLQGKTSFFLTATVNDLFNSPGLPSYNQRVYTGNPSIETWSGTRTMPGFSDSDLGAWGNNRTTSRRSLLLSAGLRF